ncbi:hypothetical protein FKM82_022302 [Ascaphus truei]
MRTNVPHFSASIALEMTAVGVVSEGRRCSPRRGAFPGGCRRFQVLLLRVRIPGRLSISIRRPGAFSRNHRLLSRGQLTPQ